MLSEKKLYSLLIEQPEKGIEEIMECYMNFVYTIAYSKLSSVCSREDIEECVSDIFYEIYRTREVIDLQKGSLKSYIAVVSKRTGIDMFRKHSKKAASIPLDVFNDSFASQKDDVEKSITDRETSSIIMSGIRSLGEPDSSIIVRKYYFGQSTKVISGELGIKENTVDKKVSRALVKLKQSLGGVL